MDNLIHWCFNTIDKLDRDYVKLQRIQREVQIEYHNKVLKYDEQTFLQLMDDIDNQLAKINHQTVMIKQILMDIK